VKKKNTIVLEGLPASGKTTLANYLRDHFGVFKVNESTGIASKNSGNQTKIFEETIDKYIEARNCSQLSIIDRGYPSILAWDYCREKEGGEHNYYKKKYWIREAIKKGYLFEPQLYIYLYADCNLSFIRRPRQETKIDVWSSKIGVANCKLFYEKFFSNKEIKKNTLFVNAEDKTKKIADILMNSIQK